MKKRSKYQNKNQLQLEFQAESGSLQKKEKNLNSLGQFVEENKASSRKAVQFVGVDKSRSSQTNHPAPTDKLIASQKTPSKDLSKKSAKSKVEETACGNKKPTGLLFDNLITVEELAVVFGLAPQTIRNWVALGKLPYVKIGRRNMFLTGSLQEWLNRKEKSQWQ